MLEQNPKQLNLMVRWKKKNSMPPYFCCGVIQVSTSPDVHIRLDTFTHSYNPKIRTPLEHVRNVMDPVAWGESSGGEVLLCSHFRFCWLYTWGQLEIIQRLSLRHLRSHILCVNARFHLLKQYQLLIKAKLIMDPELPISLPDLDPQFQWNPFNSRLLKWGSC